MSKYPRFRRLICRCVAYLRSPGYDTVEPETLEEYYTAIKELQETVNDIISQIQPEEHYPRADELQLIKYHKRFRWLMGQITQRAQDSLNRDHYNFRLTPGHPESERLHKTEIAQLRELGYRVKVSLEEDDTYIATIRW